MLVKLDTGDRVKVIKCFCWAETSWIGRNYFESLSIGLSLVGLVRVYTCGLQLNCLIILLYEFLIIVNIFKHANKPDFFSRFFSQLHKFASVNCDDLCVYFFVSKFKFMKFMYTTFHPHLSRVYYERQGSNPGKPGFF